MLFSINTNASVFSAKNDTSFSFDYSLRTRVYNVDIVITFDD